MKLKISIKILLAFLFIISLMSFLSFYLINSSYRSLQQSIGEFSKLLAEEMMERIDHDLYIKIEELRFYLNNLIQSDPILNYFNEMKTKKVLSAHVDTNILMDKLIQNDLSKLLKKNLIDSYETQYSYKIFTEIFITNPSGINIAQSGVTSDLIQSDEQWWIQARKNKQYISDIQYDESSQTYGISICIRIDDNSGNLLGIAKAILSTKGIIMEMELNIKKYKNFEATLITGDGKIIYSTKTFKYLDDMSRKEYYQPEKTENKPVIINEGGINKLFTHVHSNGYRNYTGHGWILIIAQDLKDVFEPIFTLIISMIVVSLFIIILGILISYIISRSISKPVEELIKAVTIIGNGNLDYKVRLSGRDELSELAFTFNMMTVRLKKTISDFKCAEKKLTKSLKEKEILLQELHHRVKNNLQVIVSMLRLQSDSIKEKTYKSKFKEIQNRINSISLVHEQLYQSEDFIHIDFTLYISSIINNLFRFYNINPGRIRLNLKIENLMVGLNLAIPCGLIINELISNSLKHAFPEKKKGTISVILCPTNDNEIRLVICDDGIPISKELDHFRSSESLGLYLVIILAEDQLNGTITLDREKGNKFQILFRKKG